MHFVWDEKMWWIAIVIIVILFIALLTTLIIYWCSTTCPPPPCPIKIQPCPAGANLIYNGELKDLPKCNMSGRHNNSDYTLVYPEVKTHIPFRPAVIDGEYRIAIFTESHVNHVDDTLHDTNFHITLFPTKYIMLPDTWNAVNVILYK